MLQNQPLVLAENYFITGDRSMRGHYPKEEQKEFIPGIHKEQHKKINEGF